MPVRFLAFRSQGNAPALLPLPPDAPEQRPRIVGGGLVGSAEVVERRERSLDVLARLERERIDPAAGHVKQLVPEHVTHGSELALVVVPLPQQTRARVTPPVGEL